MSDLLSKDVSNTLEPSLFCRPGSNNMLIWCAGVTAAHILHHHCCSCLCFVFLSFILLSAFTLAFRYSQAKHYSGNISKQQKSWSTLIGMLCVCVQCLLLVLHYSQVIGAAQTPMQCCRCQMAGFQLLQALLWSACTPRHCADQPSRCCLPHSGCPGQARLDTAALPWWCLEAVCTGCSEANQHGRLLQNVQPAVPASSVFSWHLCSWYAKEHWCTWHGCFSTLPDPEA